MATPFRISRTLRSACHRRAGKVLRVVLVLSLWHAPIPWIHAHEIVGPQVERLASLSRHVSDFHARELNRGATSLDWHSHLVLPWCLSHQHSCPQDDEREPGSDDIFGGIRVGSNGLAAGEWMSHPTTRAFLTGVHPADAAALGQPGAGTSAVAFSLAQCRHFFETYGCSVAIRDLLSVRLC